MSGSNPYQSPQAQGGVGWWNLRTMLVTCLYLLFMISGAAQVTRPESVILRLALSVLTAWSVIYWCVVDARALGRPIVQSLHWIMFFTWPLAAPIYLVYSRKLRGLGLAVLHAIFLMIAFTLATHLASYVLYGQLWSGPLRQ